VFDDCALRAPIRPLQWPSSVVSEPVERDHSELSEEFAPWEVGMQPEAAADAECTQPASTDVSATIEMSFFMDGLPPVLVSKFY